MLGERGITLSGGQKQRVALARALALERPVLLLDDAFASVDPGTEERILESLFALEPRPSILLATHRRSALLRVDRIIVLDEGRIVATGTHEELIAPGRALRRPLPPRGDGRGAGGPVTTRERTSEGARADGRARSIPPPTRSTRAAPSTIAASPAACCASSRPYKKEVVLSVVLLAAISAARGGRPLSDEGGDRHLRQAGLGPGTRSPPKPRAGLLLIAVAYVGVLAAAFALRYVQSYMMSMVGQRAMRDLRLTIFRHLGTLTPVLLRHAAGGADPDARDAGRRRS